MRTAYETPDIQITRFSIYSVIMDDDRNDPTVYLPEDGPLSCPDLEIGTTDPAGDIWGF